MDKSTYSLLENYMLSCMEDSAHDKEHIFRVLYNALDIAKTMEDVDYDILIAACLLHDIGRREQFLDPSLCHAKVGSEKAYSFLIQHGFPEEFSQHVKSCILTHRFRKNLMPESVEAKILFDADKLDVAGAIGVARTLVYKGALSSPLYCVLPDGSVSGGENDSEPSFFQEYKYKLEKIYSSFLTERGAELANERKAHAEAFYSSLFEEVNSSYESGKNRLKDIIS